MVVRCVVIFLFFQLFIPISSWAEDGCASGYRPIVEMLKVNEFADDLEPLVIYENGMETTLAVGGQGPLSGVINSWLREVNGVFTLQANALDFESETFERDDTEVQFLDIAEDGRITIQFCLPTNTNAVTIHAVYGDEETVGVQSTVGRVRDGNINAVANRATTAWFSKYNQGKEQSGSEQLLRIMKQQYGSKAPRALTEKQVIALNEMYAAALVAGQMTGGNDMNIDVEGTTVYVEWSPTRMCFTDATTGFWVNGENLLIDHCVTGLENHAGQRYRVETGGVYKSGNIEIAHPGMVLIANECIGSTGTVSVLYENTSLNLRTVFLQDGVETVYDGSDPEFTGNCHPLTVTTSVLGNQEQPLYRRSVTVF